MGELGCGSQSLTLNRSHTPLFTVLHNLAPNQQSDRSDKCWTYLRHERGGVPGPGLAPLQGAKAAEGHLQGASMASKFQTKWPWVNLTSRESQHLKDKEFLKSMGKR